MEGSQDLFAFDGGVLVADMLLDAESTHELQLTQFPIENGASITDHAIFSPPTMSLTLVQTQSPLSAVAGFTVTSNDLTYDTRPDGRQTTELKVAQAPTPPNLNGLIGGVTSRIRGIQPLQIEGVKADTPIQAVPFRVTALTANADVDRVNQFYADLLSLMLGVTPLDVHVKGFTAVDMVLTSVTRSDSPGQFGCARFRVQLQRIATVTTQTIQLPPVPESTRNKSRGSKPPKKEIPPEEMQSTLDRTGGGITSLFTGSSE